MNKQQFEKLMMRLWKNNQLFIEKGQTIQKFIDITFNKSIKLKEDE